jgi:hypothetical protein
MIDGVWIAVLLAVCIYCAAQAVRDFRKGNYAMAAAGAACVAMLLLIPIQSHAIKLDLPAP